MPGPFRFRLLAVLGPGILVAATGVGAGDLATASLAGGKLGLAILWAVLVGALLKFVLNEGLARWQLATGETLLEGALARMGRPAEAAFLCYLLGWSVLVGGALVSAVGVTAHAMWPIFAGEQAAVYDKIAYGIAHSALAVVLVWRGGIGLFERVMGVCIAVMFAVVVVTAVALRPSPQQVAQGLLVWRIPAGEIYWTIALIGGVGGTLTVLCYGYWIREQRREGPAALATCRIDLATAYALTAVFGLAMVVIGSAVGQIEGRGAGLIVQVADKLQEPFGKAGPAFRWAFLIGAWGAVFSSLLGVWQSVPYLFADFWGIVRARRMGARVTRQRVDTRGLPYRGYLLALATAPIAPLVWGGFREVQQAYAIVGALFIPPLAVVLLVLNRRRHVGRHANRPLTVLVLLAAFAFFVYAGVLAVQKAFAPAAG